jgi:hypothetical protein
MSRPTAPRFSLRPAAWGLKALFRSASTRPIGEEWRKFCHPSRANAAPPASQPAQHLSGSFQLNEAHVRRVLRFGYLAPDIVEAIAEGRQPGCAASNSSRVDHIGCTFRDAEFLPAKLAWQPVAERPLLALRDEADPLHRISFTSASKSASSSATRLPAKCGPDSGPRRWHHAGRPGSPRNLRELRGPGRQWGARAYVYISSPNERGG